MICKIQVVTIGEDGRKETREITSIQRTYDEKPKRRRFELLKSQGMQPNQQVDFLSDGGEDVRNVQLYLNPQAEHLLYKNPRARRGVGEHLPAVVSGFPPSSASQESGLTPENLPLSFSTC